MADKNEFELPIFLQNCSSTEIHERMMGNLPSRIDKSESGFPYDFTRVTAIEKAMFVEMNLAEAVQNIFPLYASGDYLDMHAANRGIVRRPEGFSSVEITFKGTAGTVIPQGFRVSTEANLDSSSIVFRLNEEVTITESGEAKAMVTAEKAGPQANVTAGCIVLMVKPLRGISTLVNEEASYGGFEKEDDANLRQRIADYDAQQGYSFVGSAADYRRWAREVVGVGNADIVSAKDDSGLVTIIITDLNGAPADESLCAAVYDHIMRPHNTYERLAPVNALLKVSPPDVLDITIVATIVLEPNYSVDAVKKLFVKNLIRYFRESEDEGIVRYYEVGAELIKTEGILDYSNYTLNGGTVNLSYSEGQMPIVDESKVTLIE